jgi:Zn-dependent protease/CBS domain-containing protein
LMMSLFQVTLERILMNGSLRVGTLFGIPFYLHPSWFVVLGLVTLSYGGRLSASFPELMGLLPWALGLVVALLLFASVLAHELGHSLVAISQGVEVKSISLFLFGGLANLGKESRTPAESFWVAISGPLVSLVIFASLTTLGLISGVTGPLAALLGLLASVNLALALFNLLPGLPLDGGNILKALVWQFTGSPYKGVIVAARVGQVLGWGAIAIGVIPLLLLGSFSNFWYLIIGWFLLQNAGQAVQTAILQSRLNQLKVEDAVTPNSPVVSESLSLRQFANGYVIGGSQWRQFLVTNAEGRLVGTMAVDDLKLIPVDSWPLVAVRDLMQPCKKAIPLSSNQSLLDAVTILEERQVTELPVIDENSLLLGLLEKARIPMLLQQRTQTNPA